MPEFISILRYIRDIIYPKSLEVEERIINLPDQITGGYSQTYIDDLKDKLLEEIEVVNNKSEVETIEDLLLYNGAGLAIIKDIIRGGTFVSKTAIEIDPNTGEPYAANDCTIFAKLGGGFWVRQYSGAVNVAWGGATHYSDSSAIFNSISSSFSNIDVEGDYIFGDEVIIQDDQTWNFKNTQITHLDDTKTMFVARGKKNFHLNGDITLKGLLVTAEETTERGIVIDGCCNYTINNLTVEKFKGRGVSFEGTTPAPITYRGEKGKFVNLVAKDNAYGVYIEAGSNHEFQNFVNCNISHNITGLTIAAGNIIFTGGNIVDNIDDGVHLINGSNHGHGIFNGTNINHNNRWNIWSENCVNGYTFNGCHIYGNAVRSNIFLDNSKGIVFEGGFISCPIIYNYENEGQAGYNYMRNVHFPGSYATSIKDQTGNVYPKNLIITGATGGGLISTLNGLSISTPSDVYVNAVATTSVPITSATLTTLVFPTVNLMGDTRRAYNKTTGVFTVPSGMEGFYSIKASADFAGASISTSGSYLAIYKNETAEGVSGVIQTIIPSKANGNIEQDIYLSAGDTIKIKAYVDRATSFSGSGFKSTLVISKIN